MFQPLAIDRGMVELIVRKATEEALWEAALANGARPFAASARDLLRAGATTVDEVAGLLCSGAR